MTSARSWLLAAAAACLVAGGCVCIDLTQPRRYRCGDDTQCMGGWRCGTDHFCVDPSGDALQPNAGAPAVTLAQFTPVDPAGLPDLVASQREDVRFPSSCADAGGHPREWSATPVVAQVRGDAVSVLAVFKNGRESLPDGGLPTGPDCATFTGAPPLYQERWTGSLGGRRAVDVAQAAGATYVLTESGGLCTFRFAPGTPGLTGSCRDGVFPFSPTRLRSSPRDDTYLLAHSANTYSLYNQADGGVSRPAQVAIFNGPPMPIDDMTIQAVGGPNSELLTAVNDAGLFVSSLARYRFEPDGGGAPPPGFWEPVQTYEVPCRRDPAGNGYGVPKGIRYVDDALNPMMGIHAVRDSSATSNGAAEDHVLVYRATGDAGDPYSGFCVPLPAPSSSPPNFPSYYAQALTDCAPCEVNHHLRDWRLAWQFPGPTLVLEARCLPNDGGTVETVNTIQDAINGCTQEPPSLPDIARFARPSRWDRADGYANAYADDVGHLFGSTYTEGLTLPALTLDRPPDVMVQTAPGLLAATPEVLIGNPFQGQQAVLIPRELFHQGRSGFGGIASGDQLQYLSSVAGQPTWGLVADPDQVDLFYIIENTTRPITSEQVPARFLAHFNAAVAVQPPFLGAATRNALGREVLMFSSNDVLTAVDVTALADNPNAGGLDPAAYFATPELEVRAVPLPRTPITSLVPIPPDPATTPPLFAEVFLVQGGRVFQVTAFNHTYWKVEELDLGGAEVIAVVADGRRGRAGTKDGRVYALPSRVPVAAALPGAPVLSYAQSGATTFAVAAGGLFRLKADANQPVGTWEQVPVMPVPPDGRGFQSARLFSIQDELLLFLHAGWGYRISGGR